MKKRKTRVNDPRAHTSPGHYLKNAPWRQDFIEEFNGPVFSARDTVLLVLLAASFMFVAAALWMNPPQILRFKNDSAITGQATLAGHRTMKSTVAPSYDPAKFEEVKEDDPMLQDDLEDATVEESDVAIEVKPTKSL